MLRRLTLLTHGLLLPHSPLAAQQVEVSASVPLRSPSGAGTRNLSFGTMTPVAGTTQVVDVLAAAPVMADVPPGEFRYDVAGLRGVTFNVSVPAALSATGAVPLPVSFNGLQYGGYCVSTNAGCSLTPFDPGAGADIRACHVTLVVTCSPMAPYPAGSVMRIYIGGRLSIPPSARAGEYAGVVTVTIVQVH